MTEWRDKIRQIRARYEAQIGANATGINFKKFKEAAMPLLEEVMDEYKNPLERLYPQVWGTQPNTLTFGISLDKIFQLHFSLECSGGQEYIQVKQWILDSKIHRQIPVLVKQFTAIPSHKEIEEIISTFLEEYHKAQNI